MSAAAGRCAFAHRQRAKNQVCHALVPKLQSAASLHRPRSFLGSLPCARYQPRCCASGLDQVPAVRWVGPSLRLSCMLEPRFPKSGCASRSISPLPLRCHRGGERQSTEATIRCLLGIAPLSEFLPRWCSGIRTCSGSCCFAHGQRDISTPDGDLSPSSAGISATKVWSAESNQVGGSTCVALSSPDHRRYLSCISRIGIAVPRFEGRSENEQIC
jgi:hypothetical protein